jgi:hypothetical protein
VTPFGSFADWLKAGFDAPLVVADPLVVAPEKDDYRLRPDSPAYRLGFKPIPLEKIGAKGYRD